MEMFEKVEKLRARANVSFEEAKAALEASDGDLLDAMVYLEKQGKVKGPEQSMHSTSYEEQKQYVSVREKVKSQEKSGSLFDDFRNLVHGFIDKCRGNFFCIRKNNEIRFKIPVLGFVVLILAFWQVLIPVLVLMLFLGCEFSFYGKDELAEINRMMDKASDFVDHVKDSFTKDTASENMSEKTSDTASENSVNADAEEINE